MANTARSKAFATWVPGFGCRGLFLSKILSSNVTIRSFWSYIVPIKRNPYDVASRYSAILEFLYTDGVPLFALPSCPKKQCFSFFIVSFALTVGSSLGTGPNDEIKPAKALKVGEQTSPFYWFAKDACRLDSEQRFSGTRTNIKVGDTSWSIEEELCSRDM